MVEDRLEALEFRNKQGTSPHHPVSLARRCVTSFLLHGCRQPPFSEEPNAIKMQKLWSAKQPFSERFIIRAALKVNGVSLRAVPPSNLLVCYATQTGAAGHKTPV